MKSTARRYAKLILAAASLMIGHATWAESITGCPSGQAMQSSDPSGKNITCVAINEKDIVGRYAFSGPLTCLQSNNGFNADLTPKTATTGLPNPSETQVSFFSTVASGIRTFNADGTGTIEVVNHSVTLPLIRYPAGSGTAFIAFGGPNLLPGGGASEVTQTVNFEWHLVDGKVVISEGVAKGTITKGGGTRLGWTVENFGLPNSVGVLGKDLKTLTLVNEDLQVETTVQTSPEGVAQPATYRICTRHRVLTKL